MSPERRRFVSRLLLLSVFAGTAAGTVLVSALLMNIQQRKSEAATPFVRLVPVTEDTTDPAVWGVNWPKQYDSYKRTALATRTRFGGHGGSEAMPAKKSSATPGSSACSRAMPFRSTTATAAATPTCWRTRRRRSGSPSPSPDPACTATPRSCPSTAKLGDGDAMKGFEKSHAMSYQETNEKLHDMGHAHPVSCVDCHDPDSMRMRVTRPGFIQGIQALAESEAPLPHLPSVEQWRQGDRKEAYDPNRDATRGEMRSFVCGQCHVEYYCASKMPLTFPWGKGLSVEQTEAFWDETTFPDGGSASLTTNTRKPARRFSRRSIPEFELWSQGIHARSGRVLRRLPHALHARRRHQDLRPLGAQPAAEHQPRLPDLPPRSRSRN
jgi:nitrite reductase (cytochrome c-552)